MSEVNKPVAVSDLPAVASHKVVDLAAELARIDITKFRFGLGGSFILLAVGIFVAGHLKAAVELFTPDFPGHAWTVFWILVGVGSAFSGPEVVESVKAATGLGKPAK